MPLAVFQSSYKAILWVIARTMLCCTFGVWDLHPPSQASPTCLVSPSQVFADPLLTPMLSAGPRRMAFSLAAAAPMAAAAAQKVPLRRLTLLHVDKPAAPSRNELADVLHGHLEAIFGERSRKPLDMSPAAAALMAEAGEAGATSVATAAGLRSSAAAVAARLTRLTSSMSLPCTLEEALAPSSQSLLVVEAEPPHRVLAANSAFEASTGHRSVEMQGQPALLLLQVSTAFGPAAHLPLQQCDAALDEHSHPCCATAYLLMQAPSTPPLSPTQLQGPATSPHDLHDLSRSMKRQQGSSHNIICYAAGASPMSVRVTVGPISDAASHVLLSVVAL